MVTEIRIGIVIVGLAAIALVYRKPIARSIRARGYFRGRKLDRKKRLRKAQTGKDGLEWGNEIIPDSAATRHFLVCGTTGSGKTIIQRRLLRRPLLRLSKEPDSRVLAYDAKGDTVAYLRRIGFEGELYSLNPFEARSHAVGWDAGKDITSPARAINFAAKAFPQEKGGANQYFSNAARHVAAANLKSLVLHNAGEWTFYDFVAITLNRELTKQVLSRDSAGKRVLETYLRDDKTGNDVFSTVCTQIAYFEPVAALWKKADKQLSIREWLSTNSVLLLGRESTAEAAMNFLNGQIFSLFAAEVAAQKNSSTRRTYCWIEEARHARGIIDSEAVQVLSDMGRSKGVALVLAFQDISGLREVAGDKQADNLVGQCSHKALLRCESPQSAEWASKLIGQQESLQVFRSDNDSVLTPEGKSEQRVVRDVVLPSEFMTIPETKSDFGLEGYFISPGKLPSKTWLSPQVVAPVVVSDSEEIEHGIQYRRESEQWLPEMTLEESERLGIEIDRNREVEPVRNPSRKLRLRTGAAWNKAELSQLESLEESYLADQLEETVEY